MKDTKTKEWVENRVKLVDNKTEDDKECKKCLEDYISYSELEKRRLKLYKEKR